MASSFSGVVGLFVNLIADAGVAAAPLGGRLGLVQNAYQDFWTNGTGALQGQQVFRDQRTLSATSNEDLDFTGGGLKDAVGNNFNVTRVCGLIIYAAKSNGGLITVTPSAVNGANLGFNAGTNKWKIPAGSLFAATNALAAGWPLVGAASDSINIANSDSASAVYDIIAWGS